MTWAMPDVNSESQSFKSSLGLAPTPPKHGRRQSTKKSGIIVNIYIGQIGAKTRGFVGFFDPSLANRKPHRPKHYLEKQALNYENISNSAR
jgi:hypothetical protein